VIASCLIAIQPPHLHNKRTIPVPFTTESEYCLAAFACYDLGTQVGRALAADGIFKLAKPPRTSEAVSLAKKKYLRLLSAKVTSEFHSLDLNIIILRIPSGSCINNLLVTPNLPIVLPSLQRDWIPNIQKAYFYRSTSVPAAIEKAYPASFSDGTTNLKPQKTRHIFFERDLHLNKLDDFHGRL
jgi:hypothetical protein